MIDEMCANRVISYLQTRVIRFENHGKVQEFWTDLANERAQHLEQAHDLSRPEELNETKDGKVELADSMTSLIVMTAYTHRGDR